MEKQSGYARTLTSLCPCATKIAHRLTIGASEYKVLRCFSEHTEFEQFEDTPSHCDFSAVSVFRSSRFQADRAREQVNLLDVHIREFSDSPTISSPDLYDSSKTVLGARSKQFLVLPKHSNRLHIDVTLTPDQEKRLFKMLRKRNP
jgi:hypothetical protein